MHKALFRVFIALITTCIGKLTYSWFCNKMRDIIYRRSDMDNQTRDDMFQCVLKLLLKRKHKRILEKAAALVATNAECAEYFRNITVSRGGVNNVG